MFRPAHCALPLLLLVSSCATGHAKPDDPPTDASDPPPAPDMECDMWEVTEAVGRATPAFQNCYPKAVDKDPSLAEHDEISLLLQWHVRDDGTTEHPSIARSNVDAPFLHECLKAEADKLHQPDLADRACLARHGFKFTPGE